MDASAKVEKLKISRCKQKGDAYQVDDSTPAFEVGINPKSYKRISRIRYSNNRASGAGSEYKFDRVEAEEISFSEIVLDGTGVVAGTKSVEDQLKTLRKVACLYDGDQHETPVVEVCWGPLVFRARLTSMSVNHTLFKPNGQPLRAKVDLKFVISGTDSELLRKADMQSPDLTHQVRVEAGDTLPLLCYRIYKDCKYYLEVARHNNLRDFRHLTPGQILHFPPLA
jgi:nucleoid-associated protein YgaU